MFDSHCHLDGPAFAGDRTSVIARAAAAGVADILVPGIRPSTWQELLRVCLAQTGGSPNLHVALGVHPQVVPELDDEERAIALDPDRLAAAVTQSRSVAVGECGLDGGTSDPETQQAIFRAHIRAARIARKPLVVHVLRAHDAAPRILAEEKAGEVGGVMHSYSGGAALVPMYVDLGLYVSFAGPVTFDRARRPVEAARVVPAERLLAETDAPDQTPEPHRGQRCEPAFLPEVIRGLAAARGASSDAIAALTADNARRLFGVR